MHIATAAVHGMQYLLTWNCTHIANAVLRPQIEAVCKAAGFAPPLICTPEELQTEISVMVEDDVLREVRASREAYARLHNFDVDAMVEDLRRRELASGWQVVSHPPRRVQAPASPNEAAKQEQQTGAA